MQRTLKLNTRRENFYYDYFQILNGILRLSNKELLILSYVAYYRNTNTYPYLFPYLRKQLAGDTGISIASVDNHINRLEHKGYMVRDNTGLKISDKIYIAPDSKLNLTFEIAIND